MARKIAREKKTIQVMMDIFCRQKHGSKKGLCVDCQELLSYAHVRLERCPFGEQKTACADCTVHCYQPLKRNAIVQVMRFAGPQMIFHHPFLALSHIIMKKKKLKKRI